MDEHAEACCKKVNLFSNPVEAVLFRNGEEDVAAQVLDLARPLQKAPEHLERGGDVAELQCCSAAVLNLMSLPWPFNVRLSRVSSCT